MSGMQVRRQPAIHADGGDITLREAIVAIRNVSHAHGKTSASGGGHQWQVGISSGRGRSHSCPREEKVTHAPTVPRLDRGAEDRPIGGGFPHQRNAAARVEGIAKRPSGVVRRRQKRQRKNKTAVNSTSAVELSRNASRVPQLLEEQLNKQNRWKNNPEIIGVGQIAAAGRDGTWRCSRGSTAIWSFTRY